MALTKIYPKFEVEEHLEVCPSCDRKMKAGNYVCKSCKREPGDAMVLAFDKPEFVPKRYNKKYAADSICGNCEMLVPCQERVMSGGWCFCEIPSTEDLVIVKLEDVHEARLESR